jgi:DNA polymerase-1
MLAAYLLDPGKNNYSLEDCALREFGYKMTPITDLIGTGKKQVSFATVDIETACRYAAKDAHVTFKLYHLYLERLQNAGLYHLYAHIEIPLIYVLIYMEQHGVHIDIASLHALSVELSQQIETLTNKIFELAGETFNINSPQQLSQILFKKLNITPLKKTKEGFSTDIEVLESLAENHEIAKHLIEYRHLNKMKNTYIDALPQLVNPFTKRVHSSFNQTVTSTGRLSSSHPNLQNIPVKSELGMKIRAAFSTTDDKYIVAADYSQIELRLLAAMADDKSMLSAFADGVDIHTNTAETVFHKDKNEITPNERRRAKSINFGIVYGMGATSLAKELDIPFTEAKKYIDLYLNSFPNIKSYIETQKTLAHQNQFVETIYGRKLYLTEINSSNQRVASESERIAVNMPIQGSAADVIKIAMINIYKEICQRSDIRMLIQVHDELVFEVDIDKIDEVCSIIRQQMENALLEIYRNKVTLIVDINHGKNWAMK